MFACAIGKVVFPLFINEKSRMPYVDGEVEGEFGKDYRLVLH